MKRNRKQNERGYVMLIALVFSSLSLMALAGAMKWTSTSTKNTQRNNNYYTAVGVAEAATERVLASISRDYAASGESAVFNNLANYATMKPGTNDSSFFANYVFSNAQGGSGTHVSRTVAWSYVPLESQYEGLWGMASKYKIVSNAQALGTSPVITAAVKQEFQLASIPIFQFAIFYTMDLEVNPGPNMNVTGRVHSNGNIYNQPQAILNYLSHVTAASKIVIGKSPLDPTSRTPGTVNFIPKGSDSGVSAMSLPIGTNNTPAAVRAVVEIPPTNEPPTSLMGMQRYYNKADVIVLVSNSTVTVKSGAWNNFATTVPYSEVNTWVNTNVSFYNKREGKNIKTTQIDVAALRTWSANNTIIRTNLLRDVNALYVADMRTQSGTESGVRMVNGETLPPLGLTVATPNPIYVKGHYNAPSSHRGTTNTTLTKPASLVGDAITILSTAWNDSNASSGIASRDANDTTVNAAFLAGIVQSNGLFYSGGVENFPRFLENWSNNTFTYNGSMVVMFPSQFATAPWGASDVYNPPSRNWAFDLNFMDATKLPPGTPQVTAMIRGNWAMVPAGTL